MIVANIVGGLGNQMFQYAAGRALSLRKKTSFALDTSAFTRYSLHQGFELQQVFSCEVPQIDAKMLKKVAGWQSGTFTRRIFSRKSMSCFRSKQLVIEPHFNYWHTINNLPDNCLLIGYWQSERYFSDFSQQIKKDFQFKEVFDKKNMKMVERISRGTSISLHVRRGDYVSNPTNLSIYAACNFNYYNEAIEYMAERVENPKFFIFSNDVLWVKKNLRIAFPCDYIDFNTGKQSYNDMRLMSFCKHNINANSSFSWWGAWLNDSKNKIVIAPKKWFSSPLNDSDLVPGDWVRL